MQQVTGRHIAIIGALLVVVGSFLPWATVSTAFGSASKNGLDGDGIITLALGVLMAIGALVKFRQPGSRAWLAVIFSLLALIVGMIDLYDVAFSTASISSDYVDASPGIGLYLVIVGSFLGLAALSPNPKAPEKEATKVCPQCAETVKAAARKCRFCGYEFEEAEAA